MRSLASRRDGAINCTSILEYNQFNVRVVVGWADSDENHFLTVELMNLSSGETAIVACHCSVTTVGQIITVRFGSERYREIIKYLDELNIITKPTQYSLRSF